MEKKLGICGAWALIGASGLFPVDISFTEVAGSTGVVAEARKCIEGDDRTLVGWWILPPNTVFNPTDLWATCAQVRLRDDKRMVVGTCKGERMVFIGTSKGKPGVAFRTYMGIIQQLAQWHARARTAAEEVTSGAAEAAASCVN